MAGNVYVPNLNVQRNRIIDKMEIGFLAFDKTIKKKYFLAFGLKHVYNCRYIYSISQKLGIYLRALY